MTLGIFGNQKARTGSAVANEYKVKSRGQENFGPADNHPIEEYSEEGYDHTNPKQLKLIKVKKSDTQKIKEMQDIRKEHEEIARQQKEAQEQEEREIETKRKEDEKEKNAIEEKDRIMQERVHQKLKENKENKEKEMKEKHSKLVQTNTTNITDTALI